MEEEVVVYDLHRSQPPRWSWCFFLVRSNKVWALLRNPEKYLTGGPVVLWSHSPDIVIHIVVTIVMATEKLRAESQWEGKKRVELCCCPGSASSLWHRATLITTIQWTRGESKINMSPNLAHFDDRDVTTPSTGIPWPKYSPCLSDEVKTSFSGVKG